MGMSASQSRLLSITARMHDVEYEAQCIQDSKIKLATQSDEVYQKYLEALDATTLTIKNSDKELVPATFSNLCGMNAIETATNRSYVFRAADNSIIVPNDIAEGYERYSDRNYPDDPYMFALFMIGGEDTLGTTTNKANAGDDYRSVIEAAEDFVTAHAPNSVRLSELKKKRDSILNPEENDALKNIVDGPVTIDELRRIMENSSTSNERDKIQKVIESYEIADSRYKSELYRGDNAQIIYQLAQNAYNEGKELGGKYEISVGDNDENFSTKDIVLDAENDFDSSQFNYYVKYYKAIQSNLGLYTNINDYDNPDHMADPANDNAWLQNMIQSGKITVDEFSYDKNGMIQYSSASVSSSSELAYTTTTTIDKAALAKAEAEYEHDTKLIDQKDKKFDMDLNKLETERQALKTEYDSVKKVISDNIERTFGIFS